MFLGHLSMSHRLFLSSSLTHVAGLLLFSVFISVSLAIFLNSFVYIFFSPFQGSQTILLLPTFVFFFLIQVLFIEIELT